MRTASQPLRTLECDAQDQAGENPKGNPASGTNP